jgi:two-component system cell cycle response regulator
VGARILVVEDNPANLELMAYLLRAFGHTVTTAGDGEKGLELARRESPDVVVCDVQIPKMDGYEVAAQMKAHPALRPIPIVAVTALAMVGDRDRILAAGFDGYIPKPIAPETFVAQVEAFLTTHSARRSDPAFGLRPRSSPSFAAVEKSRTVLAVDNSPVNLSLLRSTLEPFGWEVLTVENVADALALARAKRPDLILSDVHMPRRDGYDFIRAVKSDPELAAIPFVFISSTVWGETDRTRGLELGAARFILRPIEAADLLDELERCLARMGSA